VLPRREKCEIAEYSFYVTPTGFYVRPQFSQPSWEATGKFNLPPTLIAKLRELSGLPGKGFQVLGPGLEAGTQAIFGVVMRGTTRFCGV
jgi:hypothetical protein